MATSHHPQVEAARFLDRTIRLFLSEEEGLHAQTWILAVSRMAGSELQQALLRQTVGIKVGGGLGMLGRFQRHKTNARSDEGEQRLVALLLASLDQCGDPLAETAIQCPPEGSDCARLSLAQTRGRLGALVAACARSHGLGRLEMAEALTVASALAVHQCRDLVPLTLGAGLAVTGLVEGARTLAQPFSHDQPGTPGQTPGLGDSMPKAARG
jgi:hypothetical protein